MERDAVRPVVLRSDQFKVLSFYLQGSGTLCYGIAQDFTERGFLLYTSTPISEGAVLDINLLGQRLEAEAASVEKDRELWKVRIRYSEISEG